MEPINWGILVTHTQLWIKRPMPPLPYHWKHGSHANNLWINTHHYHPDLCPRIMAPRTWTVARHQHWIHHGLWKPIQPRRGRGTELKWGWQRRENQKKNTKKGMERLHQILILESTHLIWVLRCERVINEKANSPSEVESCWHKAINARLTEDKIITTNI